MIATTLMMLLLGAAVQTGAPAQAAAPQGRIAGRVVAADTGKPIAGATLRIVSFEVLRTGRTAMTDADGKFEFAGLPAGRYQLDASADFFIPVQFGDVPQPTNNGRPIDLAADQQFATADFKMPRAAAISGVLLDEFGDPAPNILVQLARVEFAAGKRRLLPMAVARTPSDDRGRFRVYNLPAGDYYVIALAGAFSAQNEIGGFAPTYFPGTAAVDGAKPIRVEAGRDQTISMTMAPVPTVNVSGKLTTGDGPPAGATVMLLPVEGPGISTFLMARGGAAPGGTFTFRNVPSGRYTVQAFGPPAPGGPGNIGAAPFGYRSIEIAAADVTDADVIIRPGAIVRGKFVFEGEPEQLAPNDLSVGGTPINFESSPSGGGPPIYSTKADWTFEVRPMHGIRILRAASRNPRWAVKRITYQAKDVTDEPIDFRNGDISDVEILMTTKLPVVEGHVQDAAGAKLTSYAVIIFASDSRRWAYPSRFVAMARANQSGQYRISGLPPDSYLAVAVPDVPGFAWQDPAWLEQLRGFATPLTIVEGETRALALTVVRR